MQALIDERCRDFSAQRRARSLLDSWLCLEMARASVKIDVAHELLTINLERVLGRVETHWDEDAAAREDRRAKGLQDEPYDVARELGRSKHGTLILISRWEALGEAVAANQGLDEAQIQMAYDLLAIPKVLRNGSRQVPAANDAPALSALVNREIGRHRTNLERSLNAADESDREIARLNIVKQRDSVTRGLKADLHRAERRFTWAEEAFHRLRQGEDPSTIIDPDTKAPIKPEAPVRPFRNRNRNRRPPNRRLRRQRPLHPRRKPSLRSVRSRRIVRRTTRRCSGSSARRSRNPNGRRARAQPPTDEPGPVPPGLRAVPQPPTPALPRRSGGRSLPIPGSGAAPAAPFFADSPGRRTIDVTAGRSGWIDRRAWVRFCGARACACAPEGPGAESLRPAQARQPIPSVRRRGSSLCKRIRPGPPADRPFRKSGRKRGRDFSRTG